MTQLEQRSHQVWGETKAFPVRSLGDLLNETFAIYGKRFRRIIGLVALVQVPVGLLALIPNAGVATFAALLVAGLLAAIVVYAVTIGAVGQHYLTGEIGVGNSYARVWLRVVSLASLALILAPVLALGAASLILFFLALGAASLILFFPAIALLILFFLAIALLGVAVPVVVVEGHRPAAALRRAFEIVRGSWLRVSGIALVILLVMIGLGLLVQIPFALASYIAAPEGASALGSLFRFAGGLLVGVVTLPVATIAFTLLYYDLRVRMEGYDLNALSQEMGVAAATPA